MRLIALSAVGLWLALAPAAWAQDAPATAPAATQPAAKGAEDDEAAPQALIDAARRSFVVVRYHLKKDTSEATQSDERDYNTSRIYAEYVDQKRPAEAVGIVLDAQGRILVADTGLEDRFIERIEVVSGAKTWPARRARLLFDAPGVLLAVQAKDHADLKPVQFVQLEEKGLKTVLLQASLIKADDEWRLQYGPIRPAVVFEAAPADNLFFGHRLPPYGSYGYTYGRGMEGADMGQSVSLLAGKDGRPVGCSLASFLDLKQTECLWKGQDLLKADGIDWGAFQVGEGACRSHLIECVKEVLLVLRQGAEGSVGETDSSSRYRSRYSGGQAAGREISVYGLAISPTEILVPRPLDSKMARQIDKLYLKLSDTQRQSLQFVGAYKDVGAFVVKLEKGQLPAHVQLAPADPGRMRPFWMARMRKRFGQEYVDLSTNRLLGKQRGYEGKYHWYAARPIVPGTLLVDLQGRCVGAYLHQRIEHEEERRLEERGTYRDPTSTYRIYTISELRAALTGPQAHMDPKIEVRPRTLAKRQAWFGVEFVPVTSDLAEMLKVEKPTRDGQVGFLLNAVYHGSPAEKMGLKVGDILLKLEAPGMAYPIELMGRLGRDGADYSGRWYGGYEEEEDEEIAGPVAPTWRSRKNFITRALDAIGVGKTVKIVYYRPEGPGKGQTATIDYKIEMGPPDFDSAPKWKNRKLGLTVKDVTYEVRHALNLPAADAGVIVANVENGSPTLIAKIFPNEILTRLDDTPLTSARQMRDLIAAARKAGKDKVRLTVLRLGKTRFADLAINEYDAQDDEGLDEED